MILKMSGGARWPRCLPADAEPGSPSFAEGFMPSADSTDPFEYGRLICTNQTLISGFLLQKWNRGVPHWAWRWSITAFMRYEIIFLVIGRILVLRMFFSFRWVVLMDPLD